METKEPIIITSLENGIQKVILNRPKKRNAINGQMYKELIKIFNESATNEDVIALAITGNGEFFSSGNDFLASFASESVDYEIEQKTFQNFINSIILYPKLLIAIVNGPAIGVAATILALFDIIYASEKAYFQTPFTKIGLSPEGCSTYTFPRIMGPSKASAVLYFGDKLTVKEAAECGFVGKIYKTDSVHEVWSYLEKISSLSKESIAATKRLLRRWNEKLLLEVNEQENIELQNILKSGKFIDLITKLMTKKSKI